MSLGYTNWSTDDVSDWLGSLSLHHLIPNFDRLQIDGPRLATLNDQDMRNKLRLKPAEVMAIKGAIRKLMEDASRPSYLSDQNTTTRRISTSPRIPAQIPRDRSGSLDKKSSRTVPRDGHRHTVTAAMDETITRQPKLVQGSVSDLVDKECKYSGWIRKQGGGYKSWKRRYLILRLGCLYYFANETASSAKGSFVLSGYKTEICNDPEIVKKYRYTLMLIPANPRVRTYYISVGSYRELTGWKEAIDSEIKSVTRRVSRGQRQNSAETMPMSANSGNSTFSYDIDDDSDEDDNPYDIPEGVELIDDDDEDHAYDDPETLIDRPEEGSGSEEDAYSKIDDEFPGGKPTVPSRPAFSLPPSSVLSASAPITSAHEELIASEDTYLPIIAGGPATDLAAAQPDLSRTTTSPAGPTPGPTPTIADRSSVPRPGHSNSDYEDDAPDENADEDDDGGYYIMFRKPDELMPESCIFDRLDRQEADRLLKEKDRDGTYLIRAGSHAGAEKVLSVWHIDRSRHYKLFKGDNSSYSLTQGQAFRNIPELLQYYTLQSHLPRSDFYLGDPFNPDDH